MNETLTGEEVAQLDSGYCPDCHSQSFLAGEYSGRSRSYHCPFCKAAFKIIPGIAGPEGKERLSFPDDAMLSSIIKARTIDEERQQKPCSACNGRGVQSYPTDADHWREQPCPMCGGTGKLIDATTRVLTGEKDEAQERFEDAKLNKKTAWLGKQ
jgi:hypothetical protein